MRNTMSPLPVAMERYPKLCDLLSLDQSGFEQPVSGRTPDNNAPEFVSNSNVTEGFDDHDYTITGF